MAPLRVAHVITKLELGGAQQNTLYTVAHLNRSLFECHLVTGPGGMLDEEAWKLSDAGIHFCPSLVRDIDPRQDLLAFRRLKDLFARLQPDIVHTHSSKAGVLGRLAARAAGVPLVIHTYHGFGFHQYQNPVSFRFYVHTERFACRKSDHLIFVSEANRRWAMKLGLIQQCTASLIRSGIRTDSFNFAFRDVSLRAKFGIPEGAPLIGMVACLKPQKDPLTFVRAADLVTRKHPGAHFLLVGDGELRAKVEKQIRGMVHPGRLTLAGWEIDIAQVFACIDLLVLTSLWEGLPRVIPEATLAGVPCIVSDIDGNREVVFEGQNGALAPPRDSNAFASHILRALDEKWRVDPVIAQKFKLEFDIDAMVRLQEDLYTDLAKAQYA